jgi:ABC-type antimicrobial peptide transport system permease subunit
MYLQPDVTSALIVESVAMVLAVGALGGIYPAWRATRLAPVELLRGE